MSDVLPWWKRTTVYQIYPRSFADSNADGIGDLNGIIERLDYLRWLGVETLWLSPFYRSPQSDFGYDISDHFEISPEYGTLEDVRRLIDEVHAHGMKIVLDMVLNHTSIEHPWFVESKSSCNSARRDFYLWRDGKKPNGKAPPNNWKSMLGGSGWHYHPHSGQWYWATFLPFQPDLNWRNPEVKRELLDVVRHWLKEGADGLRLDLFNALYKDPAFSDNPFSLRPFPSEKNPDGFFQRALHTQNHPDTLQLAKELRAVVDEFQDPPRFLVGEVFGDTCLLRRYCGESGEGLNLVFLFKCLTTEFTAPAFRELIAELEEQFPEPLHPTYVFANHDRPRAMSRLGDSTDKARLLAALQLTVRGVPFIYYGDELGLTHPASTKGVTARDPIATYYKAIPRFVLPALRKRGILINRDEARSPMPWHERNHFGLDVAQLKEADPSWLPLHPELQTINVAAQRSDSCSVLAAYRRMLALRNSSPALSSGRLELIPAQANSQHVLAYRRICKDEVATVFLNFCNHTRTVDLRDLERGKGGAVVYSNLKDGREQASALRLLQPWEAIVVIREAAVA